MTALARARTAAGAMAIHHARRHPLAVLSALSALAL